MRIFIFSVLTLFSHASVDYSSYRLVTITPSTAESIRNLQELYHKGIDGLIFVNDIGVGKEDVVLVVNTSAEDILRREVQEYGLSIKVNNVSVDGMVKETLPNSQEGSEKREEEGIYDYSQYEPLFKINNELRRLATDFKKFATVLKIGLSFEEREMLALKISTGTQGAKGTIFIQCGMHAREWITQATCMFLIKQLLDICQRKGSERHRNIVSSYTWVIMPVLNVDGYVYSHEKDRFWRKSRSTTSIPECKGVDLNRNWPFQFNVLGPHTSNSPCSPHYQGSGPSSEVEVKNVLKYLESIQDTLVGFFDIHAFGQYIFHPWAYTDREAPDFIELALIAEACSKAIKNVHGRTYKAGTLSRLLYAAGGNSMDHVYGMLGIKYSFGLELRGKSSLINFLLPPNEILPTSEEVLAGLLKAAENMSPAK